LDKDQLSNYQPISNLCDEPGAVVFSCLFIVQCCLR